jgi:hypothetical protein
MKRDAEEPVIVTLRRADTELTDDQWRCLNDMEKFVFQTTDRNPYWTGLTDASFMVDGRVHKMASISDQFTVQITPGCVIVKGSGGFHLCMRTAIVNCTPLNRPRSLLEASVQRMTGMRSSYPFDVDFVSSFFVPHNQIRCRIEGVPVRCEGVIHSDGYMRIEPVDHPADYIWFHFWLTRKLSTMPPHHTLVYGAVPDVSDPGVEEAADDEILEEVGLSVGDNVEWIDRGDGSWMIQKAEKQHDTEWVLVECTATYRMRYMVEVPKDKAEWALDTVTMSEAKEFSQEYLGEQIISHRVISQEEALELCDKYSFLTFMGDDHIARTKDWDVRLMSSASDLGPASLAYGNDLLAGQSLPTAILVDSRFVKTLGFIAPTRLNHMFLDDFWLAIGSGSGSRSSARRHRRPCSVERPTGAG